jgi:hypothetical protein
MIENTDIKKTKIKLPFKDEHNCSCLYLSTLEAEEGSLGVRGQDML